MTKSIIISLLIILLGYTTLWAENNLELKPKAALLTAYDDNITFVHDNKKADFVTNVLLGLELKHEGKSNLLQLDGNIAEQIFANNGSFDNTAEDLRVRFNQELSKHDRFKTEDRFSHTEEPRSFEDAFGRTSGRYSTFHNVFNLGYSHDLAEQLSWNARYSNDLTNFSSSNLRNSIMNTVGVGTDYSFNSATILKMNYDYLNREFQHGPSANTNTLAATLRRFLTPQLYLDVISGVDFINAFNDKNYIRPLYEVSLTQDIDENTQTGISFRKEYTTNAYTQDIFNAWRVSANLAKQLSERFRAAFSCFWGEGDYVSTDFKEKLKGVNVGLDYEIHQNTKLNLGYLFSQSDSTSETNSYAKNVILLGITYQF